MRKRTSGPPATGYQPFCPVDACGGFSPPLAQPATTGARPKGRPITASFPVLVPAAALLAAPSPIRARNDPPRSRSTSPAPAPPARICAPVSLPPPPPPASTRASPAPRRSSVWSTPARTPGTTTKKNRARRCRRARFGGSLDQGLPYRSRHRPGHRRRVMP